MNRLLIALAVALTAATVRAESPAVEPVVQAAVAPAVADNQAEPAATPKEPSSLIVVEAHDGKAPIMITNYRPVVDSVKGDKSKLLRYRLTPNLPEITNEGLLSGKGSQADVDRLNKGRDKVGTLPKITLIPCDDGCVGNSDYEKAAKKFIAAYEQGFRNGTFVPRGTMTVKVRYFKERGFLAKQVPNPGNPDIFAYSFPLEGKLVTLMAKDSSKSSDMDAIVTRAAGQLLMTMMFEVGVGKRPSILDEINKDDKTLKALGGAVGAVNDFFGKDYKPTIEPMTTAYNNLLPAIDGIEPNEVDPLDHVVTIYSYF